MKNKLLALLIVFIITVLVLGLVNVSASTTTFSPIEKYEKIDKSKDGLESYKQTVNENNKMLKETYLTDIIATITFEKAISIEELERYITRYNIKPVQIQARSLLADGTRVTIMSKTSKGYKETDSIIQREVRDSNARFVGYISMYATIDSYQIPYIQNDQITYLVDTSADSFFSGKTIIDGKIRNNVNENKIGKRFPHSLAWDLENVRNK